MAKVKKPEPEAAAPEPVPVATHQGWTESTTPAVEEDDVALADPVATVAPEVNGKVESLDADGHQMMASSMLSVYQDLQAIHDTICQSYGKSTQAPRLAKSLLRVWEELRGALNARYFSDRCSRDGLTPYYPPAQEGLPEL